MVTSSQYAVETVEVRACLALAVSSGRLVLERIKSGNVTVAVADYPPGPQ
jgi:hypothetical protein